MQRVGPKGRRVAALGILALATLLVVTPGIAGTAAASGPATHPAALGSSWAYGGNRSVTASGVARNGTYGLNASFAYTVLLNQTQGPGGLMELSVKRTMGAAYTIDYCEPNCASPAITATVQFRVFEAIDGAATVTPNASVEVNGSAVRAFGLVNSSTSLELAERENDSIAFHGLVHTRSADDHLYFGLNGSLSVALAPPLGIVPANVTPGESWSSTAAFMASGSWSTRTIWQRTTLMGISSAGNSTSSSAANHTGNLSLTGYDAGGLVLADGLRAAGIRLGLLGPLHFREGLLLVPGPADVLGSPSSVAPAGGNGTLGEAPATVDFAATPDGHFGLIASSTDYQAAGQNPSQSAGPATLSPSLEGSGSVVVQAQPQSPANSAAESGCILSGSCLLGGGSLGSSSPGASPYLRPLVGIALVGFVTLAVVGAVVAARRPRAPPRPYAGLYPPVLPGSTAPGTVPAPPPEPEPTDEENDPLGHLW